MFETDAKTVAVVASIPGVYGKERIETLYRALVSAIERAKLDRVVKRVYFTNEGLLLAGEFKLSRKKIAHRVASGLLKTFDPTAIEEKHDEFFSHLENELRLAFAEALGRDFDEIGKDSHCPRHRHGSEQVYFSHASTPLNSQVHFGLVKQGAYYSAKRFTQRKCHINFFGGRNRYASVMPQFYNCALMFWKW